MLATWKARDIGPTREDLVVSDCDGSVDVYRTRIGRLLAVLGAGLQVGQFALTRAQRLSDGSVVLAADVHHFPVDETVAHLVDEVCKRLAACISANTHEGVEGNVAGALHYVILIPVDAAGCIGAVLGCAVLRLS